MPPDIATQALRNGRIKTGRTRVYGVYFPNFLRFQQPLDLVFTRKGQVRYPCEQLLRGVANQCSTR